MTFFTTDYKSHHISLECNKIPKWHRGEEATPVEHQIEHKIGDFARKYGDYM